MRSFLIVFLSVLLASSAGNLLASDAWFVKFFALGKSNGAAQILWTDDILLLNTTSQPQTVTFKGVGGASPPSNPLPLVLPPHQGFSFEGTAAFEDVKSSWLPANVYSNVWVLHLDIPEGVIAESRDEFSVILLNVLSVPDVAGEKVSMPIFRSLVPANQPQVHLGTDLAGADSRLNVGIFNAGSSDATAVVEVRALCGGDLLSSTTVTIPANNIVQTSGIASGDPHCTDQSAGPRQRYTVVTVSQPSFSYVCNLNDSLSARAGFQGLVPEVGLGFARDESF